jgi:HTH-type transcriptional regulator, sugar sensing transcriptional regulator
MITFLEKLGLSEKEAKVYLAALELGASPVHKIAKEAGVNRATTYFILESLSKLGLISSYEKDKKAFFSAESPKYLEKYLEIKEQELKSSRTELKNLMPELEAIHNAVDKKPVVRFFEGKEGIEAIEDELYELTEKGSTIYTMANLDDVYSAFPDYSKDRSKIRINKGIHLKQIYNSKQGAIRKKYDKKSLRSSRFVPREKYPIDISFNIIPGKAVRIVTYKEGLNGISIRNPLIANSLKTLFEMAWETADKYNK